MRSKEKDFVVENIEIRGKRNIKVGKFYCVLNDRTYDTLGGIRNAIRPFKLTIKDFYDIHYKSIDEGICIVCGNQCSFYDLVVGYKKFCSDVCSNKFPEKRKIVSDRFIGNQEKYNLFLERRRFNWNNRTDDQIYKTKENIKNGQTKISKEKRLEICKLGNDKLQELCALNPSKRKSIVAKMLTTKQTNNSFSNGISGKIKTVEYKDKIFICQGYEDILIKYLIDLGIEFAIRTLVPHVNIESNKSKRYMADIYLPNYNLLIDVKSEYTMPIDDIGISKFLERQNCAYDQGYNFIIFAIHSRCINYKDRLLLDNDKVIFNNFLTMLISSQAQNMGRFNDYPVIRSTLQAIGSGSAGKPKKILGL